MPEKQQVNGSETPHPSGVLETAAAVAVIGIGAAFFRVRWIPGILIGIGAMAAPKIFPELVDAMNPVVRVAVRGGLRAAVKMREAAAVAGDELENIIAEVRAEQEIVSDTERVPTASRSAMTH
jgi:uncharacterized protein DUF5132